MASEPDSREQSLERQVADLRRQVTSLRRQVAALQGEPGEPVPARQSEARRCEQEMLCEVLNTSPAAIVVINRHGQLSFCNRRAEQTLGLTRDAATRRTYNAPEWKTTGPAGEPVPDDDLPFLRVMRTGKPVEDTRLAIERPDGRRVLLSINAAPLLDASGAVDAVVASVQDITEGARLQQELRESNAFHDAVIQCAADGVCVCHEISDFPHVRFTVWNRRMVEITGYDIEEINRDGWYQTAYPDPDVRRRAIDRMARMRVGDNLVAEPWRITCKDGSQRTLAISTSVLVGSWHEAHVLALMRDLTKQERSEQQRRHLEAQVQHVQKLESLGLLAGGIAHDFNNLLTAILGNASLALAEMPASAPAQMCLRGIETAGRRAADLCRQLLAYSGRGRFVIEPVDLNEIVREMSRMLEVSVSKKATLGYELALSLPDVMADATQIRQVIMNLITNASEALAGKSGAVRIATGAMHCDRAYLSEIYADETLPVGDYVFVQVADTGCGMDADTKSRMFEPFFTTKFTGRGLGMAAVEGIMRGHHGGLKIDSEPGGGTTIRVLFPASTQQPSLQRISRPPAACDWQGSGTVMVVDDEETVRTVAEHMLRHMGFETLAANGGREAVELYRQRHADVVCVLLDLMMPGMDGERTFCELRHINPQVHVIMTSGCNEMDVGQRFVGKSIAGFIQKPFDFQTLMRKLRESLQSS
ncbi:MAG: PAS domain S-box protein [Polyangiaceae bacterium]|jgi:PAS domain S-box-containing protein|nr:PAS domain S-box protein [Polyangiaceae bacterium]